MPHPIVIPGHSHGGDIDIPWLWIVGYAAVGVIAWIVAAIILTRHGKAEAESPYGSSFTKDDAAMSIVAGMVAGAVWPLTIAAYGVWRIVRHFTQDRVSLSKGQR
ncbi:hypothetical protein [Streptomyces sp. NPDC093589]|uniref:hypothetical protein n=1 Tax=Streptomyces sp. NPDC093589 TaxID=3366043 RepID=UPI00380D74AD